MPSTRYTIVFTNPGTGSTRQLTLRLRPAVAAVGALLTLPVLVGMGAAWKAKYDVSALYESQKALEEENENYRSATEALTGQIESLQAAISDLRAQSALDPSLAGAVERIKPYLKGGMGGGTTGAVPAKGQEPYIRALSALTGPDDTFGLIRSLLESLESRLVEFRGDVERRNALAAATPSLWPAQGWLTSRMGPRQDPVSGELDFHSGLDIAAEAGSPVYATAGGTVVESGYRASYGNLIVLDHGFGIQTRYGHLSKISVKAGDHVKRGDVIGKVGATGKATGPHLHYETLANGKLVNPLRLLTPKPRDR
jgi:murein DD-endopeptidase MepM/ murein hydrolase activator NlpD